MLPKPPQSLFSLGVAGVRASANGTRVGERRRVPPFSTEGSRETGPHKHPQHPAGLRCRPGGSGRLGTGCRPGRGAGVAHLPGRHFHLPPLPGRNRCPLPRRPGQLPPARSPRGRSRASGAARWAEAAGRRRGRPPGRRLPGPGQPEQPLRFPAGPLRLRKGGLTLPSPPPTAAPLGGGEAGPAALSRPPPRGRTRAP